MFSGEIIVRYSRSTPSNEEILATLKPKLSVLYFNQRNGKEKR